MSVPVNAQDETESVKPAPAFVDARVQAGTAPVPKRIALRIAPSGMRRFHCELAKRLAQNGSAVALIVGSAPVTVPASLDLLFGLERVVFRLHGPRLTDRVPADALQRPESLAERPDWLIDFCGDARSSTSRIIRILYDGVSDEAALAGALVTGRMPRIAIVDDKTGAILAAGVPCADNADTLLAAYECVLARVATLVVAAAVGLGPLVNAAGATGRRGTARELAIFEASSLAHAIKRRLYRLCCYAPHWRTCWRVVDGYGLWQTRTLSGTSWRVVPDPGFRFYADPFPVVHPSATYLFVEDFDHRQQKGIISVIPFGENGPRGPAQPVLEEPWHLSYPFVFEWDEQIWMIPESSANRTITLYRADPFPFRWVRESVLLDDIEASDATLLIRDGRFWMFAATRDGAGSWSDTLSIFQAGSLSGPWEAHRANPVLVDQAAARPAGRMFEQKGVLWRPVQDCSQGYGTGIGLAAVTALDDDRFEQNVEAVLRAPADWPGRRLHTLNQAGRLEFIDASAHSPRSQNIAQLVEAWSGRRAYTSQDPTG
jgi:hypothetical protein